MGVLFLYSEKHFTKHKMLGGRELARFGSEYFMQIKVTVETNNINIV